MSDELTEIVRSGESMTDDEQLEVAWAVMQKLPYPDQLRLVLYLTKKSPQLTETKFFVKFAQHPESLRAVGLPSDFVPPDKLVAIVGHNAKGEAVYHGSGGSGSLEAAIHQARHIILDEPNFGPLEQWKFYREEWNWKMDENGKIKRTQLSKVQIHP